MGRSGGFPATTGPFPLFRSHSGVAVLAIRRVRTIIFRVLSSGYDSVFLTGLVASQAQGWDIRPSSHPLSEEEKVEG